LYGDDAVTGDYDTAPGKVLEAGLPTPITITVTNSGTEDLVNVAVADGQWSGPGTAGDFSLSCDFSALGGPTNGTTWVGPFKAGEAFECSGTVPGLAAGDAHSDTITVNAEGRWSGTSVDDDDQWHGYVPDPRLDLTKWVCQAGTGCSLPTAQDLSLLVPGTPTSQWVKATTVPYHSDAEWLLVVANTGNTHLKDVTLTREDLRAGGAYHGDLTADCRPGTVLGHLAPGEATVLTCSTPDIINTAAWGSGYDVINTAAAKGSPVDAALQPIPLPDPDDAPGTLPDVRSREDTAEVNTEPRTEVSLEKYDTFDGDDATTGDFDEAPGRIVRPNTPTPITLTVTNSGTEDLVDIVVSDGAWVGPGSEDDFGLTCNFTALGGPSSGTAWAGPFPVGASFDCTGTVPALTPGDQHSDTVTVTADGRWSGEPAGSDDPWHGYVPNPSIELTKWVCEPGTGCPLPADPTMIDSDTDVVGGRWVKATSVPYGTDAEWLLVITNDGDTHLTHVTLAQERIRGAGHGDTTSECDEGRILVGPQAEDQSVPVSLAPGQSVTVRCTTADITNPAPVDSAEAIVNLAAARATPSDPTGIPLTFGSGAVPDVESEPDEAQVETRVAPSLSLEKYDTLDGDDAQSGDYDAAPGKVLRAGQATPITITVTNDGVEDVVDLVVADAAWSGPDTAGDFGLTCDFSALGGPASGTTWAGPFLVGDTFDCHGTIPGLPLGESHSDTVTVDARGEWTGEVAHDADPWHGYVPDPRLDLSKWVCKTGTGCAVPTAADLVALAAGEATAQWVHHTTVAFASAADWLIVVTNSGTTYLADVTVTREDLKAGGADHGTTTDTCAVGTNLGLLAPGTSVALTCTTDNITNTAKLGSGAAVVNTVAVTGTPSDPDGTVIEGPDGPLPDVPSDNATAEVNTVRLRLIPETGAATSLLGLLKAAAACGLGLVFAGGGLILSRRRPAN
jgi:hypothetical protein